MTSIAIDGTSYSALRDKVTIITGAASGIGYATAKLFASQGAKVVVADVSPPLECIPGSVFANCDVTNWSNVLAAFDLAISRFGEVHILVANAGVGEITDLFKDEYDSSGKLKEPDYRILDINLKGVMNCVKAAVSHFRSTERGGKIIMLASTAGYMAETGLPIYSSAKHGVVGLMRATRTPLAAYDISINCVAPWMTESNLISPELRANLTKAGVPIQKTESVAAAIAYSCTMHPWNGKTIFVCNDTFTELEGPINDTEPQWLGEGNSRLWRQGQLTRYFSSGGI